MPIQKPDPMRRVAGGTALACICGCPDFLVPYVEKASVRCFISVEEGGVKALYGMEDGHNYEGREINHAAAVCKKCGAAWDLSDYEEIQ